MNPILSNSVPLSAAATPPANARIRVLVVDDDENDFFCVSRLLTRNTFAEYELEWAPSYTAGLEALERGGHDVAIFDYRLGMGTGLELLRMAQAKNCDLPVILLTGHDSVEIDQESTRAGAADYLCKTGLTTGQLERSIRYALRHGNTLSALRKSQSQLELFMHNVPCAVAICDVEGNVLFQNKLFADHIRDFDGDLRTGASATPWILRHQERCWLVSTFPMAEAGGPQLQGFAAIDITQRVRAEEERLRQSQLIDNIMKNLPVIVGRLDAAGRIVEARGELEDCGIRGDELTSRHFVEVFPQSRDAIERAMRNEEVTFTLHGTQQGKDWHADFYAVGNPANGVIFLGRDVTERRWLEQRLLTVTDAEQQRIGADLHDGLGQKLTGLACLATALRDQLAGAASSHAEQANLIAALSNDATVESRALARGLCPVQLEQAGGLMSALTELVESTEIIHGVRCRLRTQVESFECDHLTAVQLYRITQEAVNNALRHGQARNIEVSLVSRGDEHRLTIADDGSGFDAEALRRTAQSGLRMMEYRANMIGGTLVIDSQPGLGTRVICTFSIRPVDPA